MNPVALITGASRGIGRGICLALAGLGHDVIINYAGHEDAARQTAKEAEALARSKGCSIRALIVQADVGQARDRQRLIEFAASQFNRMDLLVNNAGIASIGRRDLLEAREEEFDQLMAINLKGPFFLSQLAARWMIDHPRPPGDVRPSPKIIFVSSVSRFAVSTNRGDYCMAKAALGMMTRLYAARLAAHGIQTFEIAPGIIESDMTAPVHDKYDKLLEQGIAPIRRWGTPEDVGRAVAAIAQDAFPYSTGNTLYIDGGFHIRQL